MSTEDPNDSTDQLLADLVGGAAKGEGEHEGPPTEPRDRPKRRTPLAGTPAVPPPESEPEPEPPPGPGAPPPARRRGIPWAGMVTFASGLLALASTLSLPDPDSLRPTPAPPSAGAERLLQLLEEMGRSEAAGAATAHWLAHQGTTPAEWVGPWTFPGVPGRAAWEALLADAPGRKAFDETQRHRLAQTRAILLGANDQAREGGRPPPFPGVRPLEDLDLNEALAAAEASQAPEKTRERLLAGRAPPELAATTRPALELLAALARAPRPAVATATRALLKTRFRRLGGLGFASPELCGLDRSAPAPRSPAALSLALGWLVRAEVRQALGVPEPEGVRRAARLLQAGLPADADGFGAAWTEVSALVYRLAGRDPLARQVVRELALRGPELGEALGAELARARGEHHGTSSLGPPPPVWPPMVVSLAGLLPIYPEPLPSAEDDTGWTYTPPDPSLAARFQRSRRPRDEGP